jgi:oligogalacturonide lyase
MLTERKSLLTIRFVFVCLILALTGFAQSGPATNSSKTSEAQPPKTWIDPDTGHRVIRVTDEPDSASLYFNDNAYTPDGKEMVYSTPDGISVLDLKTFKSRRVVEGQARIIVAGYKTRTVYFLKSEGPAGSGDSRRPGAERALYSASIDTGATRKIAAIPPRGSIATINADETLAAGTYIEGSAGHDYGGRRSQQTHPLDQPRNKGEMMERTLAARLPRVLFTINIQTGERKILLHSTDWLNHLLFSPTDPTLLMFCHEGPWHKVDRIWTFRTDGYHEMLIHKRTSDIEIAGHEFWAPDGKTIWYDLQRPRGEDFWLAGYRVDTGERTWYHLQRNEWSIHFNVTGDGTLFCGDGGDPGQVAHAPDGEWIYLFRPELIKNLGIANKDFIHPGVLRSERLVNMSKHHYRLEPNVRFTPDKKWVIFRSNMFGPTYVFAVEVAKTSTTENPATR